MYEYSFKRCNRTITPINKSRNFKAFMVITVGVTKIYLVDHLSVIIDNKLMAIRALNKSLLVIIIEILMICSIDINKNNF